jgi:hypothetical protein
MKRKREEEKFQRPLNKLLFAQTDDKTEQIINNKKLLAHRATLESKNRYIFFKNNTVLLPDIWSLIAQIMIKVDVTTKIKEDDLKNPSSDLVGSARHTLIQSLMFLESNQKNHKPASQERQLLSSDKVLDDLLGDYSHLVPIDQDSFQGKKIHLQFRNLLSTDDPSTDKSNPTGFPNL